MGKPTNYWININGELYNRENASISVLDRGFLYGDSIYEVTRVYKGVPMFLEEHLQRLDRSASRIYMPLKFTHEQIKSEMAKTLKASGLDEAYIRVIITRGEGEINLDTRASENQNMVIICKEQKSLPSELYETGVRVIVAEVVRNAPEAVDPNIKSGNYLNNVLAYREASDAGAHEAVMLNDKGMVAECTTSNIWIVKDGVVKTPPIKAGLLGGITRATLLDIARENNITFEETNFGPDELRSCDECFITSSTREVLPVTTIDQIKVGNGLPGEKTRLLHSLYRTRVSEYIKDFSLN